VKIPYWHVDAFVDAESADKSTDKSTEYRGEYRGAESAEYRGAPFSGNPAGVCLLQKWPAPSLMQRIAAENNLAETAFVVIRGALCDLRWFTPTVEMDLCGHATLAAAHVLFTWGGWSGASITFSSLSGPLTVERRGEMLILDFPARPALPCEPSTVLIKGLGREPVEVRGARDYLALYASEEDVRSLQPDMALLARIDRMGVIASAPARNPHEADFVSRVFAPGVGIPEDPVTGSAHCTLIPYWSRRLGKKSLHALQVSPRGGELFCEDAGDRVKIGGRAFTYLSGEITV
jgi:PhzF family phenazine biosynthesis protein